LASSFSSVSILAGQYTYGLVLKQEKIECEGRKKTINKKVGTIFDETKASRQFLLSLFLVINHSLLTKMDSRQAKRNSGLWTLVVRWRKR